MSEVTAATCKIRAAHTPHGQCPGTAPEFPWERIEVPDPDRTDNSKREDS